MTNQPSIRHQLLVAFLLFTILPLLLTWAILGWHSKTDHLQHLATTQQERVEKITIQCLGPLRQVEQEMRSVHRFQNFMSLPRQEQKRYLTELLANREIFLELALLDGHGHQLTGVSNTTSPSESTAETTWSSREEFTAPLRDNESYYSQIHFDPQTGEPWATLSVPFWVHRTGTVEGVLIAKIKFVHLWKVLAAIPQCAGEEIYILDASDRIIAHANPSLVLMGKHHQVAPDRLIQRGLNNKEAVITTKVFPLGQQTFRVVNEHETSHALHGATKANYLISAVLLVALVGAFSLAKTTTNRIIKPLAALAVMARELSKGNYNQTLSVAGGSEFTDITATFNRMSKTIQQSIADMKTEIRQRDQLTESLRQSEQRLQQDIHLKNFLIDLHQKVSGFSPEELLSYTLEMAVALTGSKIGYIHEVNEDQKTISLLNWNKEALRECTAVNEKHYPLQQAGIWADCVRLRKPVIHNDYQSIPDRQGYPEGHSHLIRHMSLAVIEGETARLIMGVGNKEENYDDDDVQHLQLVANELQKLLVERRLEDDKERLDSQLQQAQRLESIGTLAGGIAHDFNNILSSILGYGDMVLAGLPDNSDIREQQQEVLNAGNRAKELVQQILAFSRHGERNLQPVRPSLIIKEALKLLRSTLPSTIKVQTQIDNNGVTLADPTQLHQIIMNLCTNAYHAMREKGGELSVTLGPVEIEQQDAKVASFALPPGKFIRLTVSDTGKGIPKEIQPKIFDPYFTTKTKGEGTGLGLAMVHGIVKNYGGHTAVYSEEGKGSTFHVYLPWHEAEVQPTESKEKKPLVGGNERILVVDDQQEITRLIESILKNLGYQVSSFTNSLELLNAFETAPEDFDLLITDMTMPHLTGFELAQKILSIRPDFPIILATGFSELVTEDKAKAIGIHDYLMKPILKSELAASIRNALETGGKRRRRPPDQQRSGDGSTRSNS